MSESRPASGRELELSNQYVHAFVLQQQKQAGPSLLFDDEHEAFTVTKAGAVPLHVHVKVIDIHIHMAVLSDVPRR